MSNEVRSAVADYLGPKLNAATGRLQISIPMHPTLAKAYTEELLPFFNHYILGSEAQGCFGILDTPASQAKLLDMFGEENASIKEHFLDQWERKEETGMARWTKLSEYVKKKHPKASSILVEIVFSYTYPRLDVNVSKGMNHLLKSPWCIHPKTGRVCVPLDPEMAATFDPSQTPTLRGCADDLDAAHKAGTLTAGKDISSTALHKYEAAFDAFLKRSENAIRAERVRDKQPSLDF
jgi:DNA primase small subunit